MPFVQVRDIQMYYEVAGKGPRLLYISGTGADLRNKPNIFDSPLADEFEILAFDQRGLGQTDRPDIRYTMADYANDVAALLQTLGWDRCHVMGISFGGMVGQEFALRYPDKVEHLVLCCTSSGGAGGHSFPFHTLAEMPVEEMDSTTMAITDTRHDADWQQQNPERYQAIIEQRNSRNAGADEPGRETGARRQLEARIDHDTYARLPEIKMPVLIAGGSYDGIAPPANLMAINKQIEQSRLQFFHGGHDFYDHDPLAYQQIASFLHNEI
jgi:3-oxoadipate enol-lactonase